MRHDSCLLSTMPVTISHRITQSSISHSFLKYMVLIRPTPVLHLILSLHTSLPASSSIPSNILLSLLPPCILFFTFCLLLFHVLPHPDFFYLSTSPFPIFLCSCLPPLQSSVPLSVCLLLFPFCTIILKKTWLASHGFGPPTFSITISEQATVSYGWIRPWTAMYINFVLSFLWMHCWGKSLL